MLAGHKTRILIHVPVAGPTTGDATLSLAFTLATRYILLRMITKFAFVACFAGVAMLITGLLPEDKMNKVRAALGDTAEHKNQPPVRVQLLVGGAIFLFIGLLMFGLIHLIDKLTLKGFAASGTLSEFRAFFIGFPGLSLRSNRGLKLANAFGALFTNFNLTHYRRAVKETRLRMWFVKITLQSCPACTLGVHCTSIGGMIGGAD